MSALLATLTLDALSPREPLALRRASVAGQGVKVGPPVDWFGALMALFQEAALTASQADVLRRTCEGKEPGEIAEALKLSVVCVEERLVAGTRKLTKLYEARQLSRGDQAAVYRAIRNVAERDPDPEWDPSCHPQGAERPRVQGMRPFGMVPEDLDTREAGPTYDLLTVVCKLTGSRRPQLRLQAREVSDLVSVDGGNSWVERSA